MDPDVANFAVVAVIIVGLVGALSAITVAFVRGVQKKPAPREMPNVLGNLARVPGRPGQRQRQRGIR